MVENGGGGGGGGGYAKTVITIIIPAIGITTYKIKVGAGGEPNSYTNTNFFNSFPTFGGSSEVRLNSTYGPIVLSATGGRNGMMGDNGSYFTTGGHTYFLVKVSGWKWYDK
ncbi:MAG: hypothetical protein IPM96_16705 [Ignavibacteria bacterium]|nr:hypothetical protein [Ignavibacteria bacterium]